MIKPELFLRVKGEWRKVTSVFTRDKDGAREVPIEEVPRLIRDVSRTSVAVMLLCIVCWVALGIFVLSRLMP